MMIIVSGHIDIAPADVSAFLADIEKINPGNKPDSGCLSYAVAIIAPDIARLLIAERWQDQPSLSAHLARKETLAFIGKWSDRMQGDVLKYDATNERPLMA
ncbi:putative quinol monooxygenase [Thalassospira sp. MCCC 1A01428]|uniref:putative quinol monooxygenase n=1 Tax=Thalassospira sp. MCCC 1A01428 TaxID=1470575 RepID=UPI001AF02710|nr:antibiotic biosynthesis monooxygenase [Thalassospira sp. MCCC 1A01428]